MGMGGNRLIEEGRASRGHHRGTARTSFLTGLRGGLGRVDQAGMLDSRGLDRKQLWTMA